MGLTETNNRMSSSVFKTITKLAASTKLVTGETYYVEAGTLGVEEGFDYNAASTAIADEVLIVTAAAGGRLTSKRTKYTTVAELKDDRRTFTAGALLSVVGVLSAYQATAATGNFGEPNVGGQEFNVIPIIGAADVSAFGDLTQTSIQRCLTAFGEVKIDGPVTLTEMTLASNDKITIGPNADITYDPTLNNNFMFAADGLSGIRIVGEGGKITNNDSYQAGGVKVQPGRAGTGAVYFLNCTECDATGLDIFQGDHGVFLSGSSNCKVEGNRAKNTGSYSFINTGGFGNKIISNYAEGSALDGFKCQGQGYGLTVMGNHSYNNSGDGFDLFDGFFESILTGNVAKGNAAFGFECKGTPSVDYNFRDSIVAGNIASENLIHGFSIVSVRGCSFSGNIAVENVQYGFNYDGVQNCNFTGDHAVKSGEHGFKIGNSSSCSRNVWTSCKATDSGKTTPNTYSGFWLKSISDDNDFIGCQSSNGTGGDSSSPAYGMYFEAGAAQNKIIGGMYTPNTSASFGGDVASQIITMAQVTGGFTTQNFVAGDHAAIAAETVTGYITVKDSTGALRKLAVVS